MYYLCIWVPSGLNIAELVKPQPFIEHLLYAGRGKCYATYPLTEQLPSPAARLLSPQPRSVSLLPFPIDHFIPADARATSKQ